MLEDVVEGLRGEMLCKNKIVVGYYCCCFLLDCLLPLPCLMIVGQLPEIVLIVVVLLHLVVVQIG
uniref:Transmembrane protein n=1 Tax=Meloidogyne incognita TaxID=6306 RepID=A0A914N3W9_MELIC